MGFWQIPQPGCRITRTIVWGTSWRTVVLMFGLETPGETDTPDIIQSISHANENSGTGGEFGWNGVWPSVQVFHFCGRVRKG